MTSLSKRYDVSKYNSKEWTWDFYEALHSSDQTKLAIAAGESSIENIDKYLQLTTGRGKKIDALDLFLNSKKPKTVKLPHPFDELLPLQQSNGKWEDLDIVLKLLEMPSWARVIINGVEPTVWEQATALAVAYMRQHFYLFDILAVSHDRGSALFSSNEVPYAARELLSEYCKVQNPIQAVKITATDINCNNNDSDDNDNSHSIDFNHDTVDGMDTDDESMGALSTNLNGLRTQPRPRLSFFVPNASNTSLADNANKKVTLIGECVVNENDASTVDAVSINNIEEVAVDTIFSAANTMEDDDNDEYCGKEDENNTSSEDHEVLSRRVLKLQMDALEICLEVERAVSNIKQCVKRSVRYFNDCGTYDDRNIAFDELTALLGDGAEPKEGYEANDWRCAGVPGIRPVITAFFCSIQSLAEVRLDLEEVIKRGKYGVRSLKEERLLDGNRGRWGFIWNGEDVVLKVMHCLDFLRYIKEFANWYGRKFFFLGNCLMLPFDMKTALDRLDMHSKVQDQLDTKPFVRKGAAIRGGCKHWKHQKYLTNKWKISFDLLYNEKKQFSWPTLNEMKELGDYEPLYTAMLVIYIRCMQSVNETVEYEKKFISYTATSRGQHLMTGKSGLKVERIVTVPLGYMPVLDKDRVLPPIPGDTSAFVEVVKEETAKVEVVEKEVVDIRALLGLGDAASSQHDSVIKNKNKKHVKGSARKTSSRESNRQSSKRPKSVSSGDIAPANEKAATPPITSTSSTTTSNLVSISNSASATIFSPSTIVEDVATTVNSSTAVVDAITKNKKKNNIKSLLQGEHPTKTVLAKLSDDFTRVSRIAPPTDGSKKLTRKVILPDPITSNSIGSGFMRIRSQQVEKKVPSTTPILLTPLKKRNE